MVALYGARRDFSINTEPSPRRTNQNRTSFVEIALFATICDGPAKVKASTKVFSAPSNGQWAVVSRDSAVHIRHFGGQKWAKLGNIAEVSTRISGRPWLDAYLALKGAELPKPSVKK